MTPKQVDTLEREHGLLVVALRAFVERAAKVSGFESAYSPYVGELVLARSVLASLEKH